MSQVPSVQSFSQFLHDAGGTRRLHHTGNLLPGPGYRHGTSCVGITLHRSSSESLRVPAGRSWAALRVLGLGWHPLLCFSKAVAASAALRTGLPMSGYFRTSVSSWEGRGCRWEWRATGLPEYLPGYFQQRRRDEKFQQNINHEDVPGSECATIKASIKPIL